MTYGFQAINGSNELTLSADAYTFSYIGKATRQSTTAASGNSTDSQIGFSTYVIDWPSPIIVAIGLHASGSEGGAVVWVARPAGSTTQWVITLYDTTASTEGIPGGGGGTFSSQRTDTDVYVFGLPATLSGFGMAFYDSTGKVSADLSRRPLTFIDRMAFANGVTSLTIPAVTKPAVLGFPNSRHHVSVIEAGKVNYINTQYRGVWFWGGGTTIERHDIVTQFSRDDGPVVGPTIVGPTNALLIEASDLA